MPSFVLFPDPKADVCEAATSIRVLLPPVLSVSLASLDPALSRVCLSGEEIGKRTYPLTCADECHHSNYRPLDMKHQKLNLGTWQLRSFLLSTATHQAVWHA